MIIMNKFLVFLIFSSFLSGCGSDVCFEPSELPDGYIDKEYHVPVIISGGPGPVVDLNYEIHPHKSGLKLVFSEKKYHTEYIYNNFTIQGKPKSSGVITIFIRGGMVASAGEDFERIYKINILR